MKLENVTKLDGFASASLGPIVITVFDKAGTVDHARAAGMLLARVARMEPNVFIFAVLGPDVGPPDKELRDIMSRELAKAEDRVCSVSQVIEGDGFRAAALRAVLTGMSLMLRLKRIDQVSRSVEKGAAKIAAQTGGRVGAADVVQAVAELRGPAGG